MAGKKGPIPGVIESNGRYFRNIREGGKKRWVPLTRVDEGRPALLRALADLEDKPPPTPDSMPLLVQAWERDELARFASATTQSNLALYNRRIVAALPNHRAVDVTVPDVMAVLKPYRVAPRTHNAMRAQLRELMRYAELQGWRPPGSNPTQPVRTLPTPARNRYISDSELRRIKIGCWYGKDGRPTDSGPMMCALVDVLYLTGQAIGDVLALDEVDVAGKLVLFRRGKVERTTGAAIRIRISPRLRDAFERLLAIKRTACDQVEQRTGRRPISPALICNRDGQRAGSSGISSAWDRACERAGIVDAHIHDIKAKAISDTERLRGMRAARVQAQHSTEQQTATYVRAREAEIIDSTR